MFKTRTSKSRSALMALLLSMALVAGCDNDGPAERAGESIDEGLENIRDEARDLGNRIEDACEDVTDENC